MTFILIALREYVEKLISKAYYRFESPSMILYIVLSLLLSISIGLLMGLEHMVCERGKEGTWKVNVSKLVIVGLPSLYFSLAYLWIYCDTTFSQSVFAYPIQYLLRYGFTYVSLFQMILGYVIITIFFKHGEPTNR